MYSTLLVLGCAFLCNRYVRCDFTYETRFFKQKVDHFAYVNQEYFDQRYLIADHYWKNGGPIFFYTGNEGDITMFANNTGLMWELAPKFGALLVFAEHRYYGTSVPFGNMEYRNHSTAGYLTSEQALADFATLIYYLKGTLHNAKQSAVVAFGGSYGGMLAAWLRIKYPHAVVGAIASSAPILQFADLTPCGRFAEIVTNDFQQAGTQCAKSIRRSWKVIRKFGMTEIGVQWLSSVFHLCSKLLVNDTQQLVNWLQETWQYLAMTNYPYPTNFLVPLPGHPIEEACKYLKNSSEPEKTLISNVFKAASVFQNFTGSIKCFNLSSSGGQKLGADKWSYQSCTEMVMPMCQNGITDMFEPLPWNFEAFSQECIRKYHVKPDAFKVIIMYGGQNISSASNIVFSNGELDPWSAGGVLKSVSDTVVGYVMDGAAHHLDLRSSNPDDPESVVRVRKLEERWISKWLQRNH